MNQKTKRITICIGTFLLLLTFIPSPASAASSVPTETATEVEIPSASSNSNEITPYADSIVWKYRVHNGQLQKRRWNESTATWVDRFWINC